MKPEGTAAVYGAAAAIPDAILHDVLRGYIDVKLMVKGTSDATSEPPPGKNGKGTKSGHAGKNGKGAH